MNVLQVLDRIVAYCGETYYDLRNNSLKLDRQIHRNRYDLGLIILSAPCVVQSGDCYQAMLRLVVTVRRRGQ